MTNIQKYGSVREQIEDSDLLLFRRQPGKIISKIISAAGRSVYSHAAKAIWWKSDDPNIRPVLLCCESREFRGARAITLSSQVARFDKLIDVYRPNASGHWPEYSKGGAARHMLRIAGSDYNYRGIAKAALLHLPFVQLFVNADMNDTDPDGAARFCSQACSEADRIGGGVDPTCGLADCETEPGDLARSPFYSYLWTLAA